MDLTTATPAEIDTMMVRAFGDRDKAEYYLDMATKTLGMYGEQDTSGDKYLTKRVTLAREHLATYRPVLVEALRQIEAASVEFTRRGGWSRYWLVTNVGGHVHHTTACNTCFPTTQFALLTAQSGMTADALVDLAGEKACTVCFPNAPVDVLRRKTRLEAPEAKAKREQREAEKAARQAKKIANGLTEDGSEFVVSYVWLRNDRGDHTRTERFKTERAALQWVVQYVSWGHDLHTDTDYAPGFAQVIEAVAAKHGKTIEEVTAEVEAKVAAKIKRDSRY